MNTFVFYAIIFTAYGLCLAYLLQSIEGKIWIKATVAFAFVVISTGVAFSYNSFMGWPVKAIPAKLSKLVAVHIREPSQVDKGQIYVWVFEPVKSDTWTFKSLFRYQPDKHDPKAIKFPYTKENQKRMQQAKEALEQGMDVYFGEGDGEGGQTGVNGKKIGNGGNRRAVQDGQGGEEGYEVPETLIRDPRAQTPKE